MSTTTAHLTVPPAPWSQTFQSHLAQMPSPEFVLASLTPAPAGPASASTTAGFLPRARYCIHRGMWSTLPENKHNDAPRNPRAYTSDMPTFTTDVRMHKVSEFFATSAGKADDESQIQGSGGGGPVEAVYWIKETGTQWRVRGTAWVIGNDIDETRGDVPGAVSSGVRVVKSEVGRRMQVLDESEVENWSWGKELTGHFGNCSPGMRGSWRNPPPGTPTHGQGEPDEEHKLGQKVMDLEDPIARSNFRVVVIKPDEVEQTDISNPETARRWLYTFVTSKGEEGKKEGGEGEWKCEELWP
ncbi:MAG: hypothetical protein OHK93_005470 [Ramalina farinacea]|uniref:Pyridoxamine 5'-phosphate oxidase Alr4036 family FMN-binding domain-containing protein n=1 Tax=Ramalina farinacea TaxID=258253 RepID=A0AA43QJ09_9LECA|nr:hypothetical protein [Ramalina farinacea]